MKHRTLLDEFALAALVGLLAQDSQERRFWDGSRLRRRKLAECAYDLADDMLIVRSQAMSEADLEMEDPGAPCNRQPNK